MSACMVIIYSGCHLVLVASDVGTFSGSPFYRKPSFMHEFGLFTGFWSRRSAQDVLWRGAVGCDAEL